MTTPQLENVVVLLCQALSSSELLMAAFVGCRTLTGRLSLLTKPTDSRTPVLQPELLFRTSPFNGCSCLQVVLNHATNRLLECYPKG